MTRTGAPNAPDGRRQAHRLRTERALQQAALDLFAQKGFDQTTTDEIAAQAGVSPRTFFRYFPSKESVLFLGERVWFETLTTTFLAKAPSLSDFEALADTLVEFTPRLVARRRALVLYERAVASSPTLRGRVADHQASDIASVAAAVAQRRGLDEPDETCLLLAAVVLATHRHALTRWLAGPADAEASTSFGEAFATVAQQFGPANGVSPQSR